MTENLAYAAVHNGLADWEAGYLLAELSTGRFTGAPWTVVTVAESDEPVTTMGGVRIVPDLTVAHLDPVAGGLLVLPGGTMWDAGGGDASAFPRLMAARAAG